MVSNSVYCDVWDGLLEVARIIRYYSLRTKQYQMQRCLVRSGVAFAGVGATATALDFVPNDVMSFIGIFIVALIIADLLIDPTKTVTQLKIVNFQLSKLEEQYRYLWERARTDLITDEEALREKQRILLEMNEISSFVDIQINDKINEIAQKEAFQTEENRYAQQT